MARLLDHEIAHVTGGEICFEEYIIQQCELVVICDPTAHNGWCEYGFVCWEFTLLLPVECPPPPPPPQWLV